MIGEIEFLHRYDPHIDMTEKSIKYFGHLWTLYDMPENMKYQIFWSSKNLVSVEKMRGIHIPKETYHVHTTKQLPSRE